MTFNEDRVSRLARPQAKREKKPAIQGSGLESMLYNQVPGAQIGLIFEPSDRSSPRPGQRVAGPPICRQTPPILPDGVPHRPRPLARDHEGRPIMPITKKPSEARL
jgi:hypothetical protein